MAAPAGVAALLAAACLREPPSLPFDRKPIAEVPHHGFRTDIPDDRRGNALFHAAVYTPDGQYLVTAGRGLRVWDPRTGALRRWINAAVDLNELLVVDGANHRLLARRQDIAPNMPEAHGLRLWDLRDGSIVGTIPETDRERAVPIGTTATGLAVVLREGAFETWALDGSGRRRTIPAPEAMDGKWHDCFSPMSATHNDKRCWELSPSGRWLAVGATLRAKDPANPPDPPMRFYLVAIDTGEVMPLVLPAERERDRLAGFAFSSDERTLAIGLTSGLWIVDRERAAGREDAALGVFAAGQHQRSPYLGAMAFAAGNTRVVTLGDQLQVSTFDAATGALVGRVAPPFEDWEGVLRVSADGSRAIAYRSASDVLVVIDGATGKQRGYICPYFCNRIHNTSEVAYAVSPDGRRVAVSRKLGAGIFEVDTDTLVAPLEDPAMPPRVPRD